MEIKDILKSRRQELNLTLEQVATHVGVAPATISRWESGDIANMRRDKIVALAEALEMSPAVIMGWETPNESKHTIIEAYNKLSPTAQQRAREYLEDLLSNPKNLRKGGD